ncbi:MAG: (2Fe-2S)-binding protein [Acidobacteria bacterium]|nr:(2Fe-2S)-binding protein [Acidobacteriota bacterium]MBI3488828.1 (2Fe-2S)-binding protein [Acidobacteriota bacterium]
MVKVHFRLEDMLVEAPAGTPLQAIADAAGADITFGCRTGSCGTCRVRVVEGLRHCSEPGSEERDFLKGLGSPADERLACQVAVHGDIAIDYLGL